MTSCFVFTTIFVLLFATTISACFLNSCPYRRYGRNVKCAHCGTNGDGVCAADSVCCTSTACTNSADCVGAPSCAPRSCKVGDSAGICISPVLCCSQELCQQNMKCLLANTHPSFP
uniref:GRANULINS domain-containing protein n=1 Tax=Panagrellus redivivus TaxID=6233 RepID=A0A7E4VMG0_PANRE